MKAHGEYTIKVHKKYLEIKIYGKWNYEGIVEFIDDFMKCASTISNNEWGVLTDLTHWDLSTPDTEEPMKELQKWCMENNQKYEATVIGDKSYRKFQMNHYIDGLDLKEVQQKYFATIEDARIWFKDLDLII